MLKMIKIFVSILLFLILLFFILLYNGIRIDSFSFYNFNISKFYIKLDKKFILNIDSLTYNLKTNSGSNSFENIQNNIKNLEKLLKYFQNIKINNLKLDDNEFYIFYDGKDMYFDNKFIVISGSLNKYSNKVFFDLNSLYFKDYDISFDGKAKIDYLTQEINFFGNIYIENFKAKLNIDINNKLAKFYFQSDYFKDLKFLKPLLDLPKTANDWMYDNVTGEFKLDNLYFEVDLINNEFIEDSLSGNAHILNANIRFHEHLEKITTKNIDIEFKNSNLNLNLIKPKFKNKNMEGSFVKIYDIASAENGNVVVNIVSQSKLDQDILDILNAYDIHFPILQKTGKMQAHLILTFPYSENKHITSQGKFLIEKAHMDLYDFSFYSKKATVYLLDNIVSIKNASFIYDDMIDANLNLDINTSTLKAQGKVFINSLSINSNKNENIFQINNKPSLIEIDFNKITSINLKDFSTHIIFDKFLYLSIPYLSKFYEYSKLLQENNIKEGNLFVEVKDKDNINFSAYIEGIEIPIKKNNKKINNIILDGEITRDKIKFFALDKDLKIEIDNDTNIYLRNLDVFIDKNEDLKSQNDNKNIFLNNTNIHYDNKIFSIFQGKIFLKDSDINFDITTKNLNAYFKKDGKDIPNLHLIGYYRNNFLKVNSSDNNITLKINNNNLFLDVNDYDVIFYTKDTEGSLEFQNIYVNGRNSSIFIDDKYKFLLKYYKININPKSKFINLENNDLKIVYTQKDSNVEFYGVKINSHFLNNVFAKDIFDDGNVSWFAKGSLDNLHGKVLLNNTGIKNLAVLNNILLLIETSPALINPFLAIPSLIGIATNSRYNLLMYKIFEGEFNFNYNNKENIIKIKNLNTFGNGIDFQGNGIVDFKKSSLDFKLNLIFLKDYSNIVNAVPVINYIILGDKKTVETTIDISGSINNPNIETNLVEDAFSIPGNILKRTIKTPGKILNDLIDETQK